MTDLQQAIKDVEQGKAQRICVPSKWRVWRDGDKVKQEIFGDNNANN